MNISGNQRYGNPGLARQYPYKTVLVGTSHVMEMRSDDLSGILKEPTINLSISGGLIREQAQLVELVLRQNKAQTILWEMNYPSLSFGDTFDSEGQDYPEYFYNPTIETPFRYLMSFDTLVQSFKALTGPHEVNIDNRNQQVSREFSKERVFAHWDQQVQRWNEDLRKIWARYRLTEITHVELLHRRLLPIIKQYPEVTFKLFLPPTNMLNFLLGKHIGDFEIEQRIEYRNALAEFGGQFPNVEVYDFEVDWATNENLERFRDLEHFDQTILRNIFVQISKRNMRVDRETMLANTKDLHRRINNFSKLFCSENPGHCPITLKIEN
ncbi:MAG: hypothetical protein WBM36_03985 [Lysobacterales bacterium]